MMLPPEFFDWWFAPWEHAGDSLIMPTAVDRLGQRDAYRLWCKEAGIAPGLPQDFDPSWNIAVTSDGAGLAATARLFAGLIAVREQQQAVLDTFLLADRKWCASIAATQPLLACQQVPYAEDDAVEVRGLLELARRLEHGFPGMWPRLALLLPRAMADRVVDLLPFAPKGGEPSAAAVARAQRCWRLSRHRVESMEAPEQPSSVRHAHQRAAA